mmetsp:Transcript_7269/g.20629  ORF Transcript_7269/g.20629 Transcript_7269/m.20629 type:complete len:496 (-) Transcript_7269:476-1963(-)
MKGELRGLLRVVPLPVFHRQLPQVARALHRVGIGEERQRLPEVLCPKRHAVLEHVSTGPRRRALIEVRLPARHADLCVAGAFHGAVVDVGRSDYHICIVHNENLRMHVDHKPAHLAQGFLKGIRVGAGRRHLCRLRPVRQLPVPQTEEVHIVRGAWALVLGRSRVGLVDSFCHAEIYHLNRTVLPPNDLLNRHGRRVPLGVHGNDGVDIELLLLPNRTTNPLRQLERNQVRAWYVGVLLPVLCRAEKVLVLYVHEAFGLANGVYVGLLDAANHSAVPKTGGALVNGAEDLHSPFLLRKAVPSHILVSAHDAVLGPNGAEVLLAVAGLPVPTLHKVVEEVVGGGALHQSVIVVPWLARAVGGGNPIHVIKVLPVLVRQGAEQTVFGGVEATVGEVNATHEPNEAAQGSAFPLITGPTLSKASPSEDATAGLLLDTVIPAQRVLLKQGGIANHCLLVVGEDQLVVLTRVAIPLRELHFHLGVAKITLGLLIVNTHEP